MYKGRFKGPLTGVFPCFSPHQTKSNINDDDNDNTDNDNDNEKIEHA